MKSTIKLSIKMASIALAATLAACGGGGGGPTAVLAPGIWNKTDNTTATTKFIGVVTSSANGGDVWGWTFDTTAGTSQMFTGAVAGSGDSFVTSQGTLESLSSTNGWAPVATGKGLLLPKSTVATQQSFVFDGPTTYTTSIDSLWSTTAQLNSTSDWNATWTLNETITDLVTNSPLSVAYSWAVSATGAITGTKTVQGQIPCTIKPGSAVTAREKAVVNVNVTYVCSGTETSYSGISFPLVATQQGSITTRAVWMKRSGTNEFVAQVFARAP